MSQSSQPPLTRPSLSRPDILIATWFGSGYLRPAPGTWGSLAALPFAWVLLYLSGPLVLLFAAFVLFPVGVWAANGFDRASSAHDSSEIVVDEVIGQWITFGIAAYTFDSGLTLVDFGLGFLLFRVFDIIKPFPIGWLDKRIDGGFGVMVDDVLAGIYAAVCLSFLGPFLHGLLVA